jgi:hypothetical protein
MTDGNLLTWLEAAIPGMQRHLEQYIKTRNVDHLGELAIAEMTANMVITELMVRKFPREDAAVVEDRAPTAPSEQLPDTDTISVPRLFRRGRRARTGTATAPKRATQEDRLEA